MATPITSLQLGAKQGSTPADADDGFNLDVRIVEVGSSAAALLSGTDDGCDTVRGSDC